MFTNPIQDAKSSTFSPWTAYCHTVLLGNLALLGIRGQEALNATTGGSLEDLMILLFAKLEQQLQVTLSMQNLNGDAY